ncbi:hypothetical protein M427DRAFT_131436 [Gonapodya prolifera JEL478]|uniref:Uncharacterized protein n=1 Tax=Gonapodya prolifera (strain JEL478) TaxID=1344416 RepID=A0A139ATC7_GONPJ|nr:hypothetical protein M427DRAFT_131436 [Gonapodya prolifera JEL478]|eukprot:KXS19987.1 hypothetical protein M427DRAFT_131436 [Gonapodya prolifera JEL478]
MTKTATFAFAAYSEALAASKQGRSVILVDVSNSDRETVAFLSGSERSKRLHALTHSRDVGAVSTYRADTSAQVAFNFLDDESGQDFLGIGGESVLLSNDHFDHDGLVALTVLLDPEWAMCKRELLVDTAIAGDFYKFRNRTAARVVWTIEAFWGRFKDVTSPLPPETFQYKSSSEFFDNLYREMIPRFKDIVDDVSAGRLEELWSPGERAYESTLSAINSEIIKIVKYPDLSLAFVYIDPSYPSEPSRFAMYSHIAYLSKGGDCLLVFMEKKCAWTARYRYETNVDYVSSPVPPRLRLREISDLLNAFESAGSDDAAAINVWTAGAPNDSHGSVLQSSERTALGRNVVEGVIVGWFAQQKGS